MSIAVYFKSESSDGYLYSFNDMESEYPHKIREQLIEEVINIGPLAYYELAVSDNESDDLRSTMHEILSEVFDISWSDQ